MHKVLFYSLIFVLSFAPAYGQFYTSKYDVLEERLTLGSDGGFQFELVDPLDDNLTFSGSFRREGDTLIFNSGVRQNRIEVLSCDCSLSIDKPGYHVKFMDQGGKELSWMEAHIDNERIRARDGRLLMPNDDFPDSLEIYLRPLSDKLWANPFQKSWTTIPLDCREGSGNLMLVQIDISEGFKVPFEYETKLYQEGERLYRILQGQKLEYLVFKLDTLSNDSSGSEKSDRLTPENVFSFRKVDDLSRYLDPSLLEDFWTSFLEQDAEGVYAFASPQMRKIQTGKDFKVYFESLELFYGKIKDHEVGDSYVKNSPFGRQMLIKSAYDVEFEECRGEVVSTFAVVSKDSMQLSGFQVKLEDYTEVPEIDEIASKSIASIKSKDSSGLYQQTSARFKEYTSLVDFEAFVEKMFASGVDNIRYFQSSIAVQDQTPIVFAVYELSDHYLKLIFTRAQGKESFALEGINLLPRSK